MHLYKIRGTGNTVIIDKMMMEESPMKKQQYVAAVACLVAGAIGFASVYATEKGQERKNEIAQEQRISSTEQLSAASNELEAQSSKKAKAQIRKAQIAKQEKKEKVEEKAEAEPVKEEPVTKPTVAESVLHFDTEKGIAWPLEGELLLDYSMDQTIYFPTLDQYRCNPALVIEGAVNDKVFSAAKGKIMDITENEVTGCTVKQDLGDGYTASYYTADTRAVAEISADSLSARKENAGTNSILKALK